MQAISTSWKVPFKIHKIRSFIYVLLFVQVVDASLHGMCARVSCSMDEKKKKLRSSKAYLWMEKSNASAATVFSPPDSCSISRKRFVGGIAVYLMPCKNGSSSFSMYKYAVPPNGCVALGQLFVNLINIVRNVAESIHKQSEPAFTERYSASSFLIGKIKLTHPHGMEPMSK